MFRGKRFLRPFSSKRHPTGCRADERTGAEIPDEDIIDGGDSPADGGGEKWSLNPSENCLRIIGKSQ